MKSRSWISRSRHVISILYCVRKLKKNKFQVLESCGMYVHPHIVVHRNYLRRNRLPLPLEQNLLHSEEIKWSFEIFGTFLTSYTVSCPRGPKSCDSFIRKSRRFFLVSSYTYLLTYSMEQSPSWEANRVCS